MKLQSDNNICLKCSISNTKQLNKKKGTFTLNNEI